MKVKSISELSRNGLVYLLFLCPGLNIYANSPQPKIPAPILPIDSPAFNFKTAANFDDLRHNILELIRDGKKRIWLITDSLGDGELASALYAAKTRNQDVKVYLGRDQLHAAGSRLPYLRSQSIPAYLRPRTGYTAPTFLFVDQRLYAFTRDLNSTQRAGGAEMIQASPAEVKAFVSWLKEVMVNPEIAYPRAFRGGRTPKEPFLGDSEGSYNYDKSIRGKAPEGVDRELPRVPKWKQIEEMRKQGVPVPAPEQDTQAPLSPAPSSTLPNTSSPIPVPETTPNPNPAPPSQNANEPAAMPEDPAKPARPWNPPTEVAPAPQGTQSQTEAGKPTTTSP